MVSLKVRTKDVPKAMYSNFLKRAEECFHAAQYSFGRQEWTAAAISAIHASIASCDAMCVYFLGRHAAGENHNEAVHLFKTISNKEEINSNADGLCAFFVQKTWRNMKCVLSLSPKQKESLKIANVFWNLLKKSWLFDLHKYFQADRITMLTRPDCV